MGVDRAGQLGGGRFQGARQAHLGNQIRGPTADDMAAQDFAVLLIHHQLDQPLIVAGGQSFAGGQKREFAD